jgi:S1-C subfamily serine protease
MPTLLRRGFAPALAFVLTVLLAGVAAAAQPTPVLRQAVPKVTGNKAGAGATLGSATMIGDRLAVTAYHVVDNAEGLSLKFLDGTSIPVRLVLAEPAADIAVLRADRALPAVPFALREAPSQVGEKQVVVGYRQDLAEQPSIKQGKVVSLLSPGPLGPDGREYPLISSDAPASFGDSGGAVLDSESRLTGIVRGGLNNGPGPTSLLSTPAGAVSAFLARGWVLDRNGNPVIGPAGSPSAPYQPYPFAMQSWWRW